MRAAHVPTATPVWGETQMKLRSLWQLQAWPLPSVAVASLPHCEASSSGRMHTAGSELPACEGPCGSRDLGTWSEYSSCFGASVVLVWNVVVYAARFPPRGRSLPL